MTWNNYGLKGWHIDHKKPLAAFNMQKPEQAKAAPLGPDDMLGCVLRSEFAGTGFVAITEVTRDGIVAENKFQTFNALQYNRWEYHRLGEIEDGKPVWNRCEK